jgi:hypothetical protein
MRLSSVHKFSSARLQKVADAKEEASAAVESEPLTESEMKSRLSIDIPFLGRMTWEELKKEAM